MGPVEMVLAKDGLCACLERAWGERRCGAAVDAILMASDETELAQAYKSEGMRLMEAGKRSQASTLVAVWKALEGTSLEGGRGYSASSAAAEDEDDDDDEAGSQVTGIGKGLAKGLGKAFGRAAKGGTTDELAALNTNDHAGAVTEWHGEDDMLAMSRRMAGPQEVALELAKAELVAVVKSKLGTRAAKMVERMAASQGASELQLSVGEAQRRLVRAGLPRMAARLARKWMEFHGRIEAQAAH